MLPPTPNLLPRTNDHFSTDKASVFVRPLNSGKLGDSRGATIFFCLKGKFSEVTILKLHNCQKNYFESTLGSNTDLYLILIAVRNSFNMGNFKIFFCGGFEVKKCDLG